MQGENERQWKKTKREHSSVSTEELFSLITEASSWIHYNYVPDCIYHAAQRMFPEIDRLFLIRFTSSPPLKIRASRKYKFAAYKLLFLWSTLQ